MCLLHFAISSMEREDTINKYVQYIAMTKHTNESIHKMTLYLYYVSLNWLMTFVLINHYWYSDFSHFVLKA